MDQTTLERRLQNEINALVSKKRDVFSVVLGVNGVSNDFAGQAPQDPRTRIVPKNC
jgi:hypothetical protein